MGTSTGTGGGAGGRRICRRNFRPRKQIGSGSVRLSYRCCSLHSLWLRLLCGNTPSRRLRFINENLKKFYKKSYSKNLACDVKASTKLSSESGAQVNQIIAVCKRDVTVLLGPFEGCRSGLEDAGPNPDDVGFT